jgi:hypothetical protein
MRLLAISAVVMMLNGCASDMMVQCSMKSVSGDPMYAAGCGAAMAVTALAVVGGSVVVLKEVIDRNSQSNPTIPVDDRLTDR